MSHNAVYGPHLSYKTVEGEGPINTAISTSLIHNQEIKLEEIKNG